MKNKMIIILLLIAIFLITGCSIHKTAISSNDFENITNENEYYYFDVSEKFKDDNKVKSASMAATTVWQTEFYVLNNKTSAIEMFESNKQVAEVEKTNTSYEETKKGTNYESYSLTTNKTYTYICRVDNTIIFSRVPVEYRGKTKSFVKKLGY